MAVKKVKVRVQVLSFGWRVGNRKVHVAMVGGGTGKEDEKECPWCKETLTTLHILDGQCRKLKRIQNLLRKLMMWPQKVEELRLNLIKVWAILKACCEMRHRRKVSHSKFVESVMKFYNEELKRIW